MEIELADRTCIVTRQIRDADELLRFVRAPGGEVVPDLECRLPGRGVWVGLSRVLLESAVSRHLFARGFRQGCTVDPELPQRTAELLRKRALQMLSLANKAGDVVSGFAKVEQLLHSGKAGVLIAASDGAGDGKAKLCRIGAPLGCKMTGNFNSGELGLALGRTNVIHAALKRGGLAEKFAAAADRLAAFERS